MTARFPLEPAEAALRARSLVRLPLDKMSELGLEAGDTVAIHGARTVHARVMPGPRGHGALQVDAALAQRLGLNWREEVDVTLVTLPTLATALVKLTGPTKADLADISEALFDLPLTQGDIVPITLPMGQEAEVEVIALDPAPAGLFSEATSLSLQAEPDAAGYADIGGLSEQIARVHEIVAVPLMRPELFDRLGVPAPRGVLFTGPPGSGKTLLARAIAAKTSAAFFQISGPEIVSKHYGESEAALRKLFQAAEKDAPAIIFIDEIDAIAPRRDSLSGEKQVERRVVAQLLTLMDGLSARGRIILMAATNLPDSLDPALRRPGRFDREISFGAPDATQRREILAIHLRDAPLAEDVDLTAIAEAAHGYVGADLASLAREGSLAALDRAVREAGGEAQLRAGDLFLTQADLLHGVSVTAPSSLRDTVVESPTVRFADVGGLEAEKDMLREAVIWPQAHKAAYQALGLAPLGGVLMSGPPGSGKTLLARTLATESEMNFIPVRPTRIMSQFLGEAERAIADIFTKARGAQPCLVFFDELDALAPRRRGTDPVLDRIVAQLLTEMDGLARNPGVVVLAATNRAASIDPALLRPGRFDLILPIALPDEAARTEILRVHLRQMPLASDVALEALARATEGASGAALAELVRAAARCALRRHVQSPDTLDLRATDFDAALQDLARSEAAMGDDFIAGRPCA